MNPLENCGIALQLRFSGDGKQFNLGHSGSKVNIGVKDANVLGK